MVVFGKSAVGVYTDDDGAREACAAIRRVRQAGTADPDPWRTRSAASERTLQRNQSISYATGEGRRRSLRSSTHCGVAADAGLAAPTDEALGRSAGLAWRRREVLWCQNPTAALTKDLDADLHGDVWDLLPMERIAAHTGVLQLSREPQTLNARLYTSSAVLTAAFSAASTRRRSQPLPDAQPEAVVAEIKAPVRNTYGVRTFQIIDESSCSTTVTCSRSAMR